MAGPEAILAISGLASEARIAERLPATSLISGADPARLARCLAGIDRSKVRLVVSFGIAGALDPCLRTGDLIVASSVASDLPTVATDVAIATAVRAALRHARSGTVLGLGRALATPADKAHEHTRTQALAVDMESHLAAAFCRKHGLPLLVLRAISDLADQVLPPLAGVAIAGDGRLAPVPIIRSLLADPGQIFQLPALARGSRSAHRSLGEACTRIRSVLACQLNG